MAPPAGPAASAARRTTRSARSRGGAPARRPQGTASVASPAAALRGGSKSSLRQAIMDAVPSRSMLAGLVVGSMAGLFTLRLALHWDLVECLREQMSALAHVEWLDDNSCSRCKGL